MVGPLVLNVSWVREGFAVFLVEDASAGRPKPDDAQAQAQARLRGAGVEWTTTQAVLVQE
jgi:nicotinamidase-related amidase